MGLLTSALYACLAVFGLGWYFNRWSGNFSLLLFVLTVITFAYWHGCGQRSQGHALQSYKQRRGLGAGGKRELKGLDQYPISGA